jgi:hypothetical protein
MAKSKADLRVVVDNSSEAASSGFSSNSTARLRMAPISSTTFSMSGFLHSRQPIPAVRQPLAAQARVSSLE